MVYLRAPTPEVHLVRTDSDAGGFTKELDEWIAAERTDFLAVFYAGDIAVEELCGAYRLPEDQSPQSDRELLRNYAQQLDATDDEKLRAQRTARRIVRNQRQHVLAIAEALIAKQGHLTDTELDELLARMPDVGLQRPRS